MNYQPFFQSVIKLTMFVLVIGAVIGLALGKITGEQYVQLMAVIITWYFSGRIPGKLDIQPSKKPQN